MSAPAGPVPGHKTSRIIWGGELVCSAFSLSTALLTSGDSTQGESGSQAGAVHITTGELELFLIV